MDSNAAICADDEEDRLDLASYPAEHRPSLVDVAAASMTARLSRLAGAARADRIEMPLPAIVAVGLLIGVACGALLLS